MDVDGDVKTQVLRYAFIVVSLYICDLTVLQFICFAVILFYSVSLAAILHYWFHCI